MPRPLLVFLACDLMALAIFGVAVRVLRFPHTRWLPAHLKHRWTLGVLCSVAMYLLFAVPFVLVGGVRLGAVALAGTTVLSALIAPDFWVLVRDDVVQHRREARGLFTHSHSCVLEPAEVGAARDAPAGHPPCAD